MSGSNSTLSQSQSQNIPSQIPVPATIIMETRKSLEDFRLPSQKNQWAEFKLEFLAEAGAHGLLTYFVSQEAEGHHHDEPERELKRAQAWNVLVKATKSHGRFLLQSHTSTRDPAAAWSAIVRYYEPPPPKPPSFWSQVWTTIKLVFYTIYQLLPLVFSVLSQILLVFVMITRALADVFKATSDVLHSEWGPLLVLMVVSGGFLLLASMDPDVANELVSRLI